MYFRACILVLAWAASAQVAAEWLLPERLPRVDGGELDVQIDGHLDEAIWSEVPAWTDFSVIEPDTLAEPRYRTEVRMFYTDAGLYVGVRAVQPEDTRVRRLTARDEGVARDNITLTLDPSGDGNTAYWFTVALGGSVQDGTVVPERNFSSEWDGPWYGATAETEDAWTAELFLPWSMMAMRGEHEVRNMGFYISRRVAHLDERWAMPALPPTESRFLSALRPLHLEDVAPGAQRTLYPYVSGSWDLERSRFDQKVGADLFWRPRPDVQLAATVNPDFGTVELDDLEVNLTATETFFSEKRSFFLEGQEIFLTTPRATEDFVATPRLMLVNTRRIGARPDFAPDPEVASLDARERNELSELYGAMRVTGQQGDLRYGVLAAAERDTTVGGRDQAGERIQVTTSGRRFGAARLAWDRRLASGRQVGAGATLTAVDSTVADARVGAIDGQLLTADGRWKVDAQAMWSRVAGADGLGFAADAVHTPSRGTRHTYSLDLFDRDFDINAMGYLARNDARYLRYRYERTRSDLARWRERRTIVRLVQGWNGANEVVASGAFAERRWTLANLSQLHGEVAWRPQRWDDRNSGGHGSFRIDDRASIRAGWESDASRPLSYGIELEAHQEDLGNAWYAGELFMAWRPLPNLNTRLDLHVRERNDWLLHQQEQTFARFDARELNPRLALDYFLGPRQHLRLSMQWIALRATGQDVWLRAQDGHLRRQDAGADPSQYDFAISNMIMQVRYRWELAPLSDLFVVYSRGGPLADPEGRAFDSMFRAHLSDPQDQELVVKFRYRLGV